MLPRDPGERGLSCGPECLGLFQACRLEVKLGAQAKLPFSNAERSLPLVRLCGFCTQISTHQEPEENPEVCLCGERSPQHVGAQGRGRPAGVGLGSKAQRLGCTGHLRLFHGGKSTGRLD